MITNNAPPEMWARLLSMATRGDAKMIRRIDKICAAYVQGRAGGRDLERIVVYAVPADYAELICETVHAGVDASLGIQPALRRRPA